MTTDAALAAQEDLRLALAGSSLVTLDRFTSAGRASFLGPSAVPAARPALAAGYYTSWPAVGSRTLATERGRRDGDAKHRWLAHVHADLRAACRELPGPPAFAAWYGNSTTARLAAATGGRVLTVPADVRNVLEDKTRLDGLLYTAGVRLRIPALSAPAAPPYARAAAYLGPRLVVQPAITAGGRGTSFVNGPQTYTAAVDGPGPWRISTFIDGVSSNTTVLTLPTRTGCTVYVDMPSHKPIGITALGIAAAKGAGNDWSASHPAYLVRELVDALTKLGHYLYAAYGLIGIWGADTIWTDTGLFLNEINIRNQGTTEMSGVNQILRGLPPLLIAHLTAFAGGTVTWLPPADEFNTDTVARAAVGGRAPYYIKLRNPHGHPITPTPRWHGPGVYRMDTAGRLTWLRPGAHPLDADTDRQEVLLANGPDHGVVCAPGAELGTAEGITSRPVFTGPADLTPLGQAIHRAALDHYTSCQPERTQP
ncbi:hypothetical protein [Catellatospora sichuanensis]|uniref:hypothetical protein n=1 Tax=Catellatospora sichuanensis TaxID=1969805 RepID=UPI001182BFA1|nr:hypothetical protein [Catellatospora sichuanensis]